MSRGQATFGDLYADFIAKHPGRASRTLTDLKARLVELEAGAKPRYSSDTIEATTHMIESYANGFRLASRCEMCGKEIEDPESVRRGIGPECASKIRRDADAELGLSEEAF